MKKSRLQHTEIPLSDFEDGHAAIEPAEARSKIQLQFLQKTKGGLTLVDLSPEEAHSIGSSLTEHAKECGYDPDTGETKVKD